MSKPLLIVVVEPDPDRAQPIAEGLRDTGQHDVRIIAEQSGLARKVAELRPDVVLIDIANPSRDVLEELALASGPSERPVAMFVDRSDEQLTRAAIEAGISAYVVDGLRAERIKPILDAAIARFHIFQQMRAELAATRAALAGPQTTAVVLALLPLAGVLMGTAMGANPVAFLAGGGLGGVLLTVGTALVCAGVVVSQRIIQGAAS